MTKLEVHRRPDRLMCLQARPAQRQASLYRSPSSATMRTTRSDISSWRAPDLQSFRLTDATGVWQADGSEPPVPPLSPTSEAVIHQATPVQLRQAKPIPLSPMARRALLHPQTGKASAESPKVPKQAMLRASLHVSILPTPL